MTNATLLLGDCKHVEEVKNSYTKREWLVFSKMCPRGEMSERIDYEEQPSVDDNDTPHDDCYCFEPKDTTPKETCK